MDMDILTLAALVAAYVGVAKKTGMPVKWADVLALAIATLLVLVPDVVREKIVLISTIALSATGAYTLAKNRLKSVDGNVNKKEGE